MKLNILKEQMLLLLNSVGSVVDKRGTMPILSNIKICVENNKLTLVGSDLEVELIASITLDKENCIKEGETTLPARKLIDIFKSLPTNASVTIDLISSERCEISSKKSKFKLGALPATDYPLISEKHTPESKPLNIQLPQFEIKRIFEKTSFAMAVQDVRYYLTGTLLDYEDEILKAVATDGHRLAFCETSVKSNTQEQRSVIVPKKGVVELQRLTHHVEDEIQLNLSRDYLQMEIVHQGKDDLSSVHIKLTTKLIDGKFPDYRRVIPVSNHKQALISNVEFKQTLNRAAILSNEKLRGLSLSFDADFLTIRAQNTEQDEAVDHMDIKYDGAPLDIAFNGTYLIEALGCIDSQEIILEMGEETQSILVKNPVDPTYYYVVMPMRL